MTTTTRQVREPTYEDVLTAAKVVAGHLQPTPVLASPLLGDGVLLKLETFQPTGSFKVRGALVATANVQSDFPGARVVTASAGNHGLGVAFAARALGAPATIVIPENASPAKRSALERFGDGVDVVVHGASYDQAESFALDLEIKRCPLRVGLQRSLGHRGAGDHRLGAVRSGERSTDDRRSCRRRRPGRRAWLLRRRGERASRSSASSPMPHLR